ncbi:MAG: hypothetical protein NT027_20770, partial [Proteobacteria bacterium]|nr:hypothetical protein [Pseudomonadota bacterium]
LADAYKFCDSLPGASLLGRGNFFNQKFLGSAIAHHIFRDVAEQKLDIWISSPRMGTTGNSLIIDENIESHSNIYFDDETKQKGFICIVDTRSL